MSQKLLECLPLLDPMSISRQKGTGACSPGSLLSPYWKLKCVVSQGGEKERRYVPWDPPHVMGLHSAKVPVILLTAPQFRPFRSKGYVPLGQPQKCWPFCGLLPHESPCLLREHEDEAIFKIRSSRFRILNL